MSASHRISASSLLRALLLVLALAVFATACSSTEEAVTDEEAAESDTEKDDDAAEEEATDEAEPQEEATDEPADEPTDDEAPAADASGQTEGVVASRDAALAALPADWTSTANDPEQGPSGVDDEEENPLNDCLPADLQGLEGDVDALKEVSADGEFTGPENAEGGFGPASGSVTVNAYSDPAAAKDLLGRFGDAIADPGFSQCVTDAASSSFGAPPEGAEFDIQIGTEVPGIDAEVAIQILVNAEFGGESITFDSYFVLASRGDYIVEGEFTGDGTQPFPTDIAAAVMNAVG